MLSEILPVQTCCACNDVTLMQATIITNPAIFFMAPSSFDCSSFALQATAMGQTVIIGREIPHRRGTNPPHEKGNRHVLRRNRPGRCARCPLANSVHARRHGGGRLW